MSDENEDKVEAEELIEHMENIQQALDEDDELEARMREVYNNIGGVILSEGSNNTGILQSGKVIPDNSFEDTIAVSGSAEVELNVSRWFDVIRALVGSGDDKLANDVYKDVVEAVHQQGIEESEEDSEELGRDLF